MKGRPHLGHLCGGRSFQGCGLPEWQVVFSLCYWLVGAAQAQGKQRSREFMSLGADLDQGCKVRHQLVNSQVVLSGGWVNSEACLTSPEAPLQILLQLLMMAACLTTHPLSTSFSSLSPFPTVCWCFLGSLLK